LLLAAQPAAAADSKAPPAKSPGPAFEVVEHIMAPGMDFGKDGRCRVEQGPAIRLWRLPGFPATISHFESCLTVRSKAERGLVDFELAVVGPKGQVLQLVDGALDLGDLGQASQAVNWDHLEIPTPGRYQMRVVIEGQQVATFPMEFRQREGRTRKP
jgi:hypothetical protein